MPRTLQGFCILAPPRRAAHSEQGAQRWRTTSTAGQSLAVGATGIRRWVAAATQTLTRSAGQVAAHALCEAQRQLQGVHKARLA